MVDDKLCYICCSNKITKCVGSSKSKKTNLVNDMCNCKSYIHVECLISMIKATKKSYCTVCNKSFNAYYGFMNQIIFPFHNIYTIPLLNKTIIFDDDEIKNNLLYAFDHQITERISDILNTISDEQYLGLKTEIEDFSNITTSYSKFYKENNIIRLFDVQYYEMKLKKGCILDSQEKSKYDYSKYIEKLFFHRELVYLSNKKIM